MANVNVVTREKVEALIREQVTPAIFQDTPKESVVMSLGKKLPNMSSKTWRGITCILQPGNSRLSFQFLRQC